MSKDNMTNKNRNFDDIDFSDIGGKPPVAPEAPEAPKTNKPAKNKDQIILMIPAGTVWKEIDIHTCSSEDFFVWMKLISPNTECHPTDFVTLEVRLKAFTYTLKESISWRFKDIQHAKTRH